MRANVDEVVDLRMDRVGAGLVVDLDAVHDPSVRELDDLRVIGVVDGSDDVAVSRDFLDDGRVEESRIAAARGEEDEGVGFPFVVLAGDGSVGFAKSVGASQGAG